MKAVVVGHQRNGSYLLDDEGIFSYVKGYVSLPIGSVIPLRPKAAVKQQRLASIAACLMLFFALGSLALLWNAEETAVYIDVNPSVELTFNRFDRLIGAQAFDSEGTGLLDALPLMGSPQDVVVSMIAAASDRGYLADDAPVVLVTVVNLNGYAADRQIEGISEALSKNGYNNITILGTCSVSLWDRAKDMGISPGRLGLVERLLAADPSIPIEDVMYLPVRALMIQIQEAEERPSSSGPPVDRPYSDCRYSGGGGGYGGGGGGGGHAAPGLDGAGNGSQAIVPDDLVTIQPQLGPTGEGAGGSSMPYNPDDSARHTYGDGASGGDGDGGDGPGYEPSGDGVPDSGPGSDVGVIADGGDAQGSD